MNISLTEDDERPDKLLMHRPDCPMVDRHRREGRPIATLYGIEALPPEVRKHACLVEEVK